MQTDELIEQCGLILDKLETPSIFYKDESVFIDKLSMEERELSTTIKKWNRGPKNEFMILQEQSWSEEVPALKENLEATTGELDRNIQLEFLDTKAYIDRKIGERIYTDNEVDTLCPK